MQVSFLRCFIAFLLLWSMPVSLHAAGLDWPCWRGPDHDGISKESGWATTWPAEGPKQLWKVGVGIGFSSCSVVGNRVYTMGHRDGSDHVRCLDALTGKEIWKWSYPAQLDARLYEGGPNSTPAVADGLVFTLGRYGEAHCLGAADGKLVWQQNLMKEFTLKEPGQDWWGFTGSPLVEGDLVILAAGTHGLALDKKTGRRVWFTGTGANGYASPVPVLHQGQRAIAVFGARSLGVVDAKNGRLLRELPWKTAYDVNAADPIFADGHVFLSSGYRTGGGLFKLGDGRPTEVWKSAEMHNQMNPSVLLGGHLFGVSGQNGRGGDLRCVEFMTGAVQWKEPTFGMGSVMAADGKLIALSEKGELIIAEAKPDAFKALARAQVLGGRCWTVPVLSHGLIYCRNARGDLVCLDVRGKNP